MSRSIHAGTVLAFLASGCGRFGFDEVGPLADAPVIPCVHVGHDEDVDGIDDGCDLCPYKADYEQPDLDGDRVGDACDPHPTEPRDRFVMFDPFTVPRAEWSFPGVLPTYAGEQLDTNSTMTQFRADLDMAPTTDTYTFGAHVTGGDPTGQRQISMYLLGPDAKDYYFCSLDGDQTTIASWQQTTYRTGGGFSSPIFVPADGPVESRDFVMELTQEPDSMICRTTWPTSQATITAARPAGIVPVKFAMGTIGLRAEYSFFAWVHSD